MSGERQVRDQIAHRLDEDVVGLFLRRQARDIRMLVARDPLALLALGRRARGHARGN